MTMKLLDGRAVREQNIPLLIGKIKGLSFVPCLVIIQIGNRPDSDAFIRAKKSFAKKIGVNEMHIQLDEKVTQDEVLSAIRKYNNDKDVQGIIVQLPLPIHLNSETIIDSIDPKKDVDGLTPFNMKRLVDGHDEAIIPATARGIRQLLKFYNIDWFGKKVTVVGRSTLVGKPISLMCLNENATVTVCHSRTSNLEEETRSADILIVAIGKPNFIGKKHIKEEQILIDVGISRQSDGTLTGDVNFEEVKDIVEMITPVPGGVGQMTVLALFENLADLCYNFVD
jgi:methylenetetrahydrofolate dehydrogenase (NADP+)/methenyltetrahydrofolate cyclohydrolase